MESNPNNTGEPAADQSQPGPLKAALVKYSGRAADLVQAILESPFIARLSRREKIFVSMAAAAILIVVLYFAVATLLTPFRRYDSKIRREQAKLEEVTRLAAEYQALHQKRQQLELRINSRGRDFSILTFLEKAASTSGVKDRISSMDPQVSPPNNYYKESAIQVKMDAIYLSQLLDFLDAIEKSPSQVKVQKLQIKTNYNNPQTINVIMVVSTYQLL